MSIGPTVPLIDAPSSDLSRLKNEKATSLEQEKLRLRKATKEFESFFMYYMLKTMRETVPENPLTKDLPFAKSLGKDTFNQLFDMELSRSMASDGHGSISELLYNQFEKLIDAKYDDHQSSPEIKPLRSSPDQPVDLKEKLIPIRDENKTIKRKDETPQMFPVSQTNRQLNQDPIRARYGAIIDKAAEETKLDSTLIASVIRVESDGDAKAVSPAGAKGLMQLVDSTAQEYGVKNSFDPAENVMAGSKYLKHLLDHYGDLEVALAAYNAGPGNVNKHGGVPPFRETQQYVKRVTTHLEKAGVKIPRASSKE
ncbi:MAG: transglycosylase SLT domain-containing protein [Candidatus Zixiibacteriota bacterium]|jgi:Rod binding domain-containing protein